MLSAAMPSVKTSSYAIKTHAFPLELRKAGRVPAAGEI